VEAAPDGVIVSSPIAEANFLFRTPSSFRRAEAPEGFAVALATEKEGAVATIRLRIGDLTATEARAGLDAFVEARDEEYRTGVGGKLGITGGRGRRLAAVEGKELTRLVLVVFDGPRRYELFLEARPADSLLAAELGAIAEGFTILSPQGAPASGPATAADAAASRIDHDYYRLNLLKPKGFLRQEVDPGRDPGIFLHLLREDETKSRCEIFVRVCLAKAFKESVDARAAKRHDQILERYESPKAPKRPTRGRWPGAKVVYRFKLAGRAPGSGAVVEEEWLLLEHENGRIYEVQVSSWGGAARAFKKDIDAFWKNLRIENR